MSWWHISHSADSSVRSHQLPSRIMTRKLSKRFMEDDIRGYRFSLQVSQQHVERPCRHSVPLILLRRSSSRCFQPSSHSTPCLSKRYVVLLAKCFARLISLYPLLWVSLLLLKKVTPSASCLPAISVEPPWHRGSFMLRIGLLFSHNPP